ncbi:Sugar and other transporter [Aspergillus sclerotialis]|uniref:Sugar and other transporter n=1 Tax=Aspergillus sclerotialis TaxID=2070753 RepID=A0A3A2ZDP7_9EURO|nr:Sugar and other transporter [Aspergillus sclerotialis]
MIYETKGLSLEQVNELYGNVSKAWRSPSYRSELRTLSVSKARRRSSIIEEKPSDISFEDASKV